MGRTKRVKTGIPGLDRLMEGGIPERSHVVLMGPAGSGKTSFCCQFLHVGASRYKENGIYLSFEEKYKVIMKNAATMGFDLKRLEEQGKLSFIKYDRYHVDEVPNVLESRVKDIGAKRVVIDSISAARYFVREEADFRRLVLDLSNALKRLECTVIFVSEEGPDSLEKGLYGIEEFIAEGIIVLYYERGESGFERRLHVWKMEGSGHSENLHPYKITRKGIAVQAKGHRYAHERPAAHHTHPKKKAHPGRSHA